MNYLHYLEKEIHSVIMATVDDSGLPVTCAIDIMDSDENGLYFLTAKGKGFYDRLKKSGYAALTGMKGSDTLSCVTVSVRGKVQKIGNTPLKRLFEKNPYMNEIYLTEQSRQALTVFRLYEGSGEWFDLSKKPIERAAFTIGDKQEKTRGYEIPSGLCKTYKTARSRGRNRQDENYACLTKKDKELFTSCYRSCLEPAEQNGLEKPYAHLLNIVKGKGYFVLTTNVGHQFQLAGFDKKRLFYAQGDYGLWQCSKACHDKTYDNEEIVRRMVATQKNLKIHPQMPRMRRQTAMRTLSGSIKI